MKTKDILAKCQEQYDFLDKLFRVNVMDKNCLDEDRQVAVQECINNFKESFASRSKAIAGRVDEYLSLNEGSAACDQIKTALHMNSGDSSIHSLIPKLDCGAIEFIVNETLSKLQKDKKELSNDEVENLSREISNKILLTEKINTVYLYGKHLFSEISNLLNATNNSEFSKLIFNEMKEISNEVGIFIKSIESILGEKDERLSNLYRRRKKTEKHGGS